MPLQPQQLGLQAAFSDQVAQANSTLKTLMGGKQKSWMANLTPAHPSPRPYTPQSQQPQKPLQQFPTSPTNVLPSPDPSDQPSPAVSNTRDSPNPRPLSSTIAIQRQQNTGDPPSTQPSTSSSFASQPSDKSLAHAEADASAWSSISSQPPAQSVQSLRPMAPPSLPRTNEIEHVANGTSGFSLAVTDLRSPRLPPEAAPDEEHPNKRRRIGSASGAVTEAESVAFRNLAARIERQIAQQGGETNLSAEAERARFKLLRSACAEKDVFYLTLHQLYCLWSINPQLASAKLPCASESTDRGFGILETVLKKNDVLSRANLEWCAAFPEQISAKSRHSRIDMVAAFLDNLSQHWPSLLQDSFNRLYPYLVDEMLGRLQCFSILLQRILFTSSRRRLSVVDGALGLQMERLFAQDQTQHLDPFGEFRTVILSDDPADLEQHNQRLIQRYRQIVSKAKDQEKQLQLQHQQVIHQQVIHQQAVTQQRQRVLQQQRFIQQQQAQQQAQQRLIQQQQAQAIHQAYFQQQPPPQAVSSRNVPNGSHQLEFSHFNHQYDQNHVQAATAHQTRSVSHSGTSSQFFTMPTRMAVAHPAGTSPSLPQNSFVSPDSGRQLNYTSQDFVLQNSPTMTMPAPPTTQTMSSRQNYTQQHQDQYFRHYQIPQVSQAQVQAQWSGDMNSTMIYHSPQTSTTGLPGPMSPVNFSMSPQFRRHQINGFVPVSTALTQRQTSSFGASSAVNNSARAPPRTIIPQPGQIIDRSEYSHSHQERKSFFMSFHQAHARSPDRTRRIDDIEERYYQAVLSFAVAPLEVIWLHDCEFTVTPEQFSLLSKIQKLPPLNGQTVALAAREYTSGSLRYRLRCVQQPSGKSAPEHEWVTKEMSWPEHIFMCFNDESLVVRRSTHNGKDMPVELTDFVVPGTNRLKVVMHMGSTADEIAKHFFFAVEILETLGHSEILKQTWTNGQISQEETLEKIRSRVSAVPDEDGIAVIDRTGVTASELSVDLTDPFSTKTCTIPARGASCTHMECFDLETWLTTRPAKQQIKCGHQKVCTCPKRVEPSEPDKWKCPICFADARPKSLRIDSFLYGVRKQLEEQDKLDTKSILVAADGTWRPVAEPLDDDDAGSDGDGPSSRRRPVAALWKRPSKSASVERAVEVIELDSD